ncbi:exodeoxyribonuclease V subunit beta [Salinicola sp. MH3R3-1]|uniref:exodeoxyribonuclease V subunit beta n=1 Tax=Salinicola sp. MH3R3-1 TaxID=1928762 RepID=UPI00094E4DFD|nr:exodeoxyribonuclease V subunit beta [Salinicola sp. MH3R3-1]OLO07312.1 exodeoxyribonuclease V subunit beta [Salinicola sp. MH3R3-1]
MNDSNEPATEGMVESMSDPRMPDETVPLELTGLPLTGHHLIEASAGTGKTFTLAALYVRLVLGPLPGRETVDFPRPLTPPEILVVTFTEAATAELRGRIRARLKQARDWLLASPETRQDAVLADLLEPLATAGEAACRSGARRLDQAARLMDEAAIFTIHGFCQRMLTRHAFDAGARFSAELLQDGQTLLNQAVEDYWRREFYPLDERWQRQIRAQWSGPEALAGALRPLLKDGQPQPLWVAGEEVEAPRALGPLFAELESGLDERATLETSLTAAWDREAIAEIMAEAFRNQTLNKTSYKSHELEDRLAAFETWLAQGDFGAGDGITDSSGRFWLSQQKLDGALVKAAASKGQTAPTHPFFALLDRLAAIGQPFSTIARQVLVHARDQVAVSFAADKRRRGLWEFSDLLNDLDAALARPQSAAATDSPALRLAARIRHELPVALIDEFQDTDPVQYRIFSHIYRAPDSDPAATALLMIGDPKQAIYAFRGADIHTYLDARRATPSRFTLMRNFRSTQSMVDATNALFLRHPQPFGSDEIPFVAVESNPKATRLVDREGQPVEALGVWWPDTERHARNDYQNVMAAATRAEVQRLLEGEWRFVGGTGERAVKPADIAILVRHGGEALKVRAALADGGIRSVYLSERSSVFDTPQAFELLQLFEAVAQPRQDSRLKAALATKLLNESPQALEPLLADELAWEREVERFSDYHRQWQRRGVLPMLRAVMRDFRIAERLAQRADGERALTDLLHLGELAQNAQQRLDGEQALLRWWHRALQEGVETLDSQALSQRLESDEDLVRVITVHKSKGLEYPIVLLPFICSHRPAEPDRNTKLLALRPAEGEGSVMVASPDDAQTREADLARLDEDVRLLYVAMTRAAYACRMGVAHVGRGRGKSGCLHETALGRLLGSEKDDDGAALLERLRQGERAGWLAIEPPPALPDHRLRLVSVVPQTKPARRFQGRIDDDWWIASYTALIADARQDTGRSERGEGEGEGIGEDEGEGIGEDDAAASEDLPATLDVEVSRERDPVPRPRIRSLFDFPRGPRPGTFLHGLLEMLDFDRLADPAYADTLRRDVERRLVTSGFDVAWAPLLLEWLLERLRQPLIHLDGQPVQLDRLEAWRTELEFWLPATAAWSEPLDRLVTRLEPLPGPRPRLAPRKLNGMLKGYIDLVFQVHGRWYVLDWKSNHLGDDPEDYQGARLAAAMVDHRYDLQYVLYVLALHRLLKSRLEDYDYDRHVGGACYVFLRGLSRDSLSMAPLSMAPEAAPDPSKAPISKSPEGAPELSTISLSTEPGDASEGVVGSSASGVFHRRPSRALIEALDAWLDGDAEPARALIQQTRRQPAEADS